VYEAFRLCQEVESALSDGHVLIIFSIFLCYTSILYIYIYIYIYIFRRSVSAGKTRRMVMSSSFLLYFYIMFLYFYIFIFVDRWKDLPDSDVLIIFSIFLYYISILYLYLYIYIYIFRRSVSAGKTWRMVMSSSSKHLRIIVLCSATTRGCTCIVVYIRVCRSMRTHM
jgi:hypothetical protein